MRVRIFGATTLAAGLLLVGAAPAFANQSYGAIYYSASADAEGMAWSAVSDKQAEGLALKTCQANSSSAPDCKFQLRFHAHQCGAFASDSKKYGFGRAETSAVALTQATTGLDTSDRNFVSLVHCNADKADDGVADTGSTNGGSIAASATPSPSATMTPQPQAPNSNYFATPQPVATVQPRAATSTVTATAFAATPAPFIEQTQRFALVGLKVYDRDVIEAIVPVYAPLGAGNVLGNPIDAPMLGNQTPVGSPIVVMVAGSVITELNISNASYDGANVAYRIGVAFSPLTAAGIGPQSNQTFNVGDAKVANLAIKEDLKPSPGQYFVKFNVTPVLAGTTYVVGDISVDQQQL